MCSLLAMRLRPRYTIPTMITETLALLVALFNFAQTQAPVAPTAYVYASRPNGSSFLKMNYDADAILATTSSDGSYAITLCSAKSCRNTDEINLGNIAFVAAARGVGCTVYEDASFVCPKGKDVPTGTVYEDGSIER